MEIRLADRLFTVIADFRGTTHIAQIPAQEEKAAVLGWAALLRTERPFGRASTYIARSIETEMDEFPPVAIRGTANVLCSHTSCGSASLFANIVETVSTTRI